MTSIYVPLDLQINTLLRLPVKSLLRFRCVSKLWSSIITSKDFKIRHLNITSSSTHPRLLIAFKDFYDKELVLVSSPNPNPSSSSSCIPYRDLNLLNIHEKSAYNSVRGLICLGDGLNVVICNPSTRQFCMSPQIKFKVFGYHPVEDPIFPRSCNYFFGYDPVEDQYKVLSLENFSWRLEHKVIVFGKEEAWRDAPCVECPHLAHTLGLCMNGILYYGASTRNPQHNSIIVSFDVRLETFNIIKVPHMGYKYMYRPWIMDKTLINYGGKIGVIEKPCEGSFRMWVVEDAEKEEWSTNTFHLPEYASGLSFHVMDSFHTGEICLVSEELSDPFCLHYYNLKKKSMRSVTIEGLPVSKFRQVFDVMVLDHCESLMFLET